MKIKVARDRWLNRPAFLFAAIGSAAGLGNAWRFPYVCYQNGGGAFLIPFLIALITAGIPLLILEFALGQKMQAGAPGAIAKIKKGWEGLGWGAIIISFVIMTYYAVIMAWGWNYLTSSLSVAWRGKAAEFFYRDILSLTVSPLNLGEISVPVIIGLALTWLIVWLILHRGVKVLGKVVLITVPLPVILLLILTIRAISLPGAFEGLSYYLKPDFSVLLDYNVWLAAYSQVFFSLSLGFGIMIAYASYLPRKSDITSNAIITAIADALIAFIAGFAVFGTLGYMAGVQNVDVEGVVTEGIALAFIAYPEAISLLPVGAGIFGLIFFLTLITLGIDSVFSITEAVITGFDDKFKISRSNLVAIICILGFLSGIIFTFGSGLYWLDIIDFFITNFGLAIIGLLQCILVGWVYNPAKMRAFINPISDRNLGVWWDYSIKYFTPFVLGISVIAALIQRIRFPYQDYPTSSLFLGGWLIIVLIIPISFFLAKVKASQDDFYLKP